MAGEERGVKAFSQKEPWKKGVAVITAPQPLPEDLRSMGEERLWLCECVSVFSWKVYK